MLQAAAILRQLPAKLVDLRPRGPLEVDDVVDAAGAGPRIELMRAALRDATKTHFTNTADRELALRMFNDLTTKVWRLVLARARAPLCNATGVVCRGAEPLCSPQVGGAMESIAGALDGVEAAHAIRTAQLVCRCTAVSCPRLAAVPCCCVQAEYEGELSAAGDCEGYGTLRFRDGSVYEGEFKSDKQEGRGVHRFALSGNMYSGEFKSDEQDGRGVTRYASGDVYDVRHVIRITAARGPSSMWPPCRRFVEL